MITFTYTQQKTTQSQHHYYYHRHRRRRHHRCIQKIITCVCGDRSGVAYCSMDAGDCQLNHQTVISTTNLRLFEQPPLNILKNYHFR